MKTLHLAILTALLASATTAQPFNFDISFALGTPQGSFQQSLERDSYGLDFAFTYQIGRNIPIHIGAGMMYQNYGWRERETQFVDGAPEVDINVRTTNNMITPQLIMRIEPTMGGFSPFIEGSVGFNYLYTESSITDMYDDEEIASTVNYDYFTSNSGIGAGAKFRLWQGYDDDGDFIGVHLILKTKYMLGGEAMYLKEGDLIPRGNDLEYIVSRSRTDLTTFNVGVVFNF